MAFKTIITNTEHLKMKQANAKQKQWMKDIAEWSIDNIDLLYGDEWSGAPFHIHHVLGRTAKHNKVPIGHWFLLPVPIAMHDPNLNHEFHVGKCKKAFVKKFGRQSDIFQCLVGCIGQWGYDLPPDEVYNAIMDTNA